MNRIAIVCAALCLSACVSNQYTLGDYNAEQQEKFPPIAVFRMQPSAEFHEQCEAFNRESALQHCRMNPLGLQYYQAELQKSDLFHGVGYADRQMPYRLAIAAALYNRETAGEIAGAAVSGLTLMLMPMKSELVLEVQASLNWYDHTLKEYRYQLPYTQFVGLLNGSASQEQEAAQSIVSHLLADFQRDQVFEAAYLYQVLEAENYLADMHLPQEAADFLLDETALFHHPLFGAQTRYLHSSFQFDMIDVFVYPIGTWEWRDLDAVFQREADKVRREIEESAETQNWSNLEFETPRRLQWNTAGGPVVYFSGTFTDEEQQPYTTHTLIASQKDKFIKLRGTFADTGGTEQRLEPFARALLPQVQVPDESVFMARARQFWSEQPQEE